MTQETSTQTPPPSPHVEWGDWTVDDTDTAREIMNYLGYGDDASREPGADRRRDKIAAMIRARIDAATAPAPEKHVAGLDEATKQKLLEALRFSASRSVMSAEDERRILAALETPAPSSRAAASLTKEGEQ